MPTQKTESLRREKLATFFYDLAKLVFAGTVVSVFIPIFSGRAHLPDWGIFFFGIVVTVVFAFIANRLLKF